MPTLAVVGDTTDAQIYLHDSSNFTGSEGMVRLVDRVDVNGFATGTLQVFYEGAWGAVCTTNFDNRNARVACRQLGFDSGITRPRKLALRDGSLNQVCSRSLLVWLLFKLADVFPLP